MPVRRVAVVIALALLATATPAVAAPAGSTVLVSRPDGLGPVPPAFDNSSDADGAISHDGRYVLFHSQADGFASGVDPFHNNLFVRDTQTGATTFVNRSDGPDGAGSNQGANDADLAVATIGGQPHVLVVFATFATNLVDHPTGIVQGSPGREHVWLRDVTAGETTLVSRADGATGARANNGASDPAIAIASSGPVVSFTSSATNLGAAGSDGVYLRRLAFNDTELISCANASCPGSAVPAQQSDVAVVPASGGDPICPSPSHNECILVAFITTNTTLTGDPNANNQVMLAVVDPGVSATTFRVLSFPDQVIAPHANSAAFSPAFSGDGRAVAFLSAATNLTLDTMTPGLATQAFVRIPGASPNPRTFLLSKADGAGGAPADAIVHRVVLGGPASGLKAVFTTGATNLGGISTQAYLRDHAASTTRLVNRAPGPAGTPGNRFSDFDTAISGDGSTAAFATTSTNLGDGDPGRFVRTRVRRLSTPGQELELVSRPPGFDPFRALTDNAGDFATSADGRFVAFGSRSMSLSDIDDDTTSEVYVRDLLTNRTTLASRADGADGAPAPASLVGISDDGRRVAFSARNLSAEAPVDTTQVYVRDLVDATTTLVSRVNGPTGSPSPTTTGGRAISADGRVVLFVTESVLDPAASGGVFHLYARDLAANTTTLVDRGPDGSVAPVNVQEASLDADGTRVVWASAAAYAGAPADGRTRIFLRDRAAETTTLVSRAEGLDGAPASFDSRDPVINAAGTVVAFESRAQNLGETFVNTQVFVRDVDAGHTELVSRASGIGKISAAAGAPSIDASGRFVTFGAAGTLDPVVAGATFAHRIFVRDVETDTTALVSRADGVDGAPSDASSTFFSSISANGNCVAFNSASTNLGDGFASADFAATHMRVLRGECPIPPPIVAPAPAPGPGPGQTTPTTTTTPPSTRPPPAVLTALTMKPARFRTRGRRRGTTIGFRLDKAARVTLTFERLVSGRRVAKRCVANRRRGKRCTIVRRAGRLTVNARKGANSRRFTGVLAGKRLVRGRYRLKATPAGGRTRTIGFRVL